ncbi:hypothetical protein HU200_006321 [Digitaria exilis]|uniref:FAD-binding PCMH-type domain-containing protein n=1 Tax=Digitaria exilis TaxID=1010633 RepID=A0A835FQ88_9POAL|nr:hypothetical protein HU200_006321 [Digitaria exilis]CAB3446079.1 unnamed protein product [Digitaria exilis]
MALRGLSIAALLLVTFSSACYPSCFATSNGFIQCLTEHIPSELIFTPGSINFTSILVSTSKNSNFLTNTTVKPICIVTVKDASHVQAAVVCGRWNGVRLRVRSGGHDYEGLSYRSARAEVFAVVDLANLHTITVCVATATAWVDSGATIGQLYHAVAKTSPELGFPAGECPTIGVGGHFRGGGIGMMMRQHGLAVDHIVDAKLVDANGEILDRATMGEDLFWAIRGGAGESFGIVLSWKVTLVKVPSTVTMFRVTRTVEQGAVDIVTKWQDVGPTLPWDMNMMVKVQRQQAMFQALYLGRCDAILPTITSRLPELNATRSDCEEMTWLEAMAVIGNGNTNTTALLYRNVGLNSFFKVKSDYVRRAIDKGVWQNIFNSWFSMNTSGWVMLEPHGGVMGTIPTEATPYPHRNGVLYIIQYIVGWSDDGSASAARNWINNFYGFMAPYVTTSPREAYVNFRDLDIGEKTVVVNDVSTFDSCKMWGEKYFGGNFQRLAMVKGKVDPTDYFWNEQSIPPLLFHATR